MVIKKTINKEAIKEMPKVLFPGQIHMVQTPWEAEKAVTYLKQYPLLGIDSETRPSFTKGQSHKVALLQVSSEKDCFLFRLNLTGLTLEAREKLARIRPKNLGQAGRIPGVSPSDVAQLSIALAARGK